MTIEIKVISSHKKQEEARSLCVRKCVRVYVGGGGVSVNNTGTSVPEASA